MNLGPLELHDPGKVLTTAPQCICTHVHTVSGHHSTQYLLTNQNSTNTIQNY